MLICMKPTIKQIRDLHAKISKAVSVKGLSYADIAKISNVDQSQVSRICRGGFKTFSSNVVQVCIALNVKMPYPTTGMSSNLEWKKAQASMRRIWLQTPGGEAVITRMLDAIADLQDRARTEEMKRTADGAPTRREGDARRTFAE